MDRGSVDDPLKGLIADQYQIERRLGAGGMGEVYLARDTRLKRPVAIKAIQPSLLLDLRTRSRFRREARLACSVNHPYVATVFDVIEHGDHMLIVMEYLPGRHLGEVLRDDPPDAATIKPWLVEIAEALAAIHRAGIVHRDIKPGNVMVTESGHVKITDFGLAYSGAAIAPDEATETTETLLTHPGAALGTPRYMAPEQLRGEPTGPSADLFSFGVLAWSALYGEHPFARESAAKTASAILHEPPSEPEPSMASREAYRLHPLLLRLLNKDPQQRYASADELLAELRVAAADREPTPPGERWRRIVGAAAVVMVGLLIAGGAALYWLRQPVDWSVARYVLTLPPFVNESGDPAGDAEASMIVDLLTRDLQSSYLVRVEGPEQLVLAGLGPTISRTDLGLRAASARDADYVLLGTLTRERDRWVVDAEIQPVREGRHDLPPIHATGDGALPLAEELAAALRRRLPDVSRLTALRDDRVDLARLTSKSEEARRAFDTGIVALRSGRVVEAIESLEQATSLDARFTLAWIRLADALDQAGYGRRARDAADQTRELLPSHPTLPEEQRLSLEVRATRARIFGPDEEWVNAAQALSERFPDEPRLIDGHAQALRAAFQQAEALQLIDRALLLDSRDPGLRISRARLLNDLGRHDESLGTLNEARALFELLHSAEGFALVERERAAAVHSQERLPEAARLYSTAADLYAAAGRPVSAAEAWLAARGAMLEQGDVEGAEAPIDAAQRVARETGNRRLQCLALNARGILHAYRGDWDGALRFYRESVDEARLLENSRLKIEPLGNLVSLLVWLQRLDETGPLMDEFGAVAEELGQDDMIETNLINQAEVAGQTGNLDDAIDAYKRLLARPRDAPKQRSILAHLGLAYVFRQRAELGQALEHLDVAVEDARRLERPSDLGRSLQNRARVLSSLGRTNAAKSDLGEAEHLAVDFPDLQRAIQLMRGLMAFDRGRWNEAQRAAAKIDGHSTSLRLMLSCAASAGAARYAEAEALCEKLLDSESLTPSEQVEARAWLAWILAQSGQSVRALDLGRDSVAQAKEMGLLLVRARAAAAIAVLPGASVGDDRDALVSEGVGAIREFFAAAPEEDRPNLRQRPDVIALVDALGI